MIYLFGSYKGGPGKSTAASNIAALLAGEGRDVLVVDCDGQGSVMLWSALRAKSGISPAITCVQSFGDTVHEEISKLAPKFDDVVIDTPGRDSHELRSAMLIADVLVTPVEVSFFNVSTLGFMREIIQKSRIYNPAVKCLLLPNKLHTNPARRSEQLRRIEESAENLPEYILMDNALCARVAFMDVTEEGRAVTESSDPLADVEMRRVFEEICHG